MRMPYYILSKILYRVIKPCITSLILLKTMYRISIFYLFYRLFERVQNFYCSPEKKEKLASQYSYGKRMFCLKNPNTEKPYAT